MQGDDGSEYQENGLFERPLGQRGNGRNRDYSLRGINETVSCGIRATSTVLGRVFGALSA